MIRATVRFAVVIAMGAGVGWTAARAQTSEPHFEIVVTAPSGETTIECRRGCELAWVERGLNRHSTPMQTFTFTCDGVSKCSSHRVGGWIKP
jgi:hypothetical protein